MSVQECDPVIIVHGGAFNLPQEYEARYYSGTQEAALHGFEILQKGGTALDAVEAAVKVLEDNPVFNAGHGSVLTAAGTVEMDAIIVDGSTLKTGAVTCVPNVSNPVSLARQVMEKTSHCLLAGTGAVEFAQSIGFPLLGNPLDLISEESVCKSFVLSKSDGKYTEHIETYINEVVAARDSGDMERIFKRFVNEKKVLPEAGHDTVGAVAVDCNGHIACATSTGGMPGKMVGRVGDSPLFGCGAYADSEVGCSSTGHGESLIRSVICRQAAYFLEQGHSTMAACRMAIDHMLKKTGGRGGIIMVDSKSNIGFAFSSAKMAWAAASARGLEFGMLPGDHKLKELAKSEFGHSMVA